MKTPLPRSSTRGPVWRSTVRLVKGCSRLAMSRVCTFDKSGVLDIEDFRLSRRSQSTLWCASHEMSRTGLAAMRFQLLAARGALGALVLGLVLACMAVG